MPKGGRGLMAEVDTDATGTYVSQPAPLSGKEAPVQSEDHSVGILPATPALHQTPSRKRSCYVKSSEGVLAAVIVLVLGIGGEYHPAEDQFPRSKEDPCVPPLPPYLCRVDVILPVRDGGRVPRDGLGSFRNFCVFYNSHFPP